MWFICRSVYCFSFGYNPLWAHSRHYLNVCRKSEFSFMLIKQAGAEEEMVLTYSGIAPQLVWSNSVESVVFRILFHWQWRVKVVLFVAI